MRRIAATAALEWLRALAPDGVGFDPTGWEAETWVLHAMYERTDLPGGLTHDDVRRIEVAAGVEEPVIVNNVNIEGQGIVIGNSLGRSGNPGPGWITDLSAAQDVVYELRLAEVMDLYGDASVPGSPINLWPTDSSWFVLTDWDLWGTKVSGARELVTAIGADPVVETTSVPSAPR
jgi:hypothetical protein